MHPIIEDKLTELRALCRQHGVARLDLFGSAAGRAFDPDRSDLDFVLEYLPEARENYPDAYFELKSGLEALFGRPVDLVMINAVRNPHFREEMQETRVCLYAA